jgi:hypothetical protein
MSGNDRKLGVRQLAIDHMKIGPANSTGFDPHPDFPGCGLGLRSLFKHQGPADRAQYHGFHHRRWFRLRPKPNTAIQPTPARSTSNI